MILNAVRDTVSPLPNPKDPVAVEWWKRRSEFLTKPQIEAIMTLILDEARISRGFGLFIRPDDLDTEISFWLVYIDYFGGPSLIAEKFPYEEFLRFVTNMLYHEFGDVTEYYFNLISRSKPKIVNSNNAFNVHLDSVRGKILNAIYNNMLPSN